eukprot:jgi/Tetstr1/449673/TSEL_036741.t1
MLPPEPEPDEVVLKVAAAAVNPADTYIREGKYKYLPETFPFTPGIEGSGTVLARGANVKGIDIGDHCLFFGHHGQQSGSQATFCTAAACVCHKIPDSFDLEVAAAAAVAYWTAFRALQENLPNPVTETDMVFIHGASGAVGLACLQTAKAMGASSVICSAGTRAGSALLYQEGASLVLDHNDEDHMQELMDHTGGKGVNVVVEMLSNVNLGADLKVLSPRGRVAIVGSRGSVVVDPRDLMLCEGSIHGVYLWGATRAERERAMEFLLRGVASGVLRPRIGRRYPLSEAAAAHQEVISRTLNIKGKILLIP